MKIPRRHARFLAGRRKRSTGSPKEGEALGISPFNQKPDRRSRYAGKKVSFESANENGSGEDPRINVSIRGLLASRNSALEPTVYSLGAHVVAPGNQSIERVERHVPNHAAIRSSSPSPKRFYHIRLITEPFNSRTPIYKHSLLRAASESSTLMASDNEVLQLIFGHDPAAS